MKPKANCCKISLSYFHKSNFMKKFLCGLALLALGLLTGMNASTAHAEIAEGAIVKTANNPDVYIIKYNAGKRYKRLILNPSVFSSYGHLKWENLLTIPQWEIDTFITSSLVRVYGTAEIYELVPEGDTGGKYLITSLEGLDGDSVYTINSTDFNSYNYRGTKGIKPLPVVPSAPPSSATPNDKISVTEIQPYLSGIGEILCLNSTQMQSGSGTLAKYDDLYMIITNKHVIANMTSCVLITHQNGDYRPQGIYVLDTNSAYLHDKADLAVLRIAAPVETYGGAPTNSPAISSLNYNAGDLSDCQNTNTAIGSPVTVLGYPAYTQTMVTYGSSHLPTGSLSVTEGIISGYSPTSQALGLPYFDYYTSAKIDSGNSGGLALTKEHGQICAVGIPTWLSTGNYETIGIIQNMHNLTEK